MRDPAPRRRLVALCLLAAAALVTGVILGAGGGEEQPTREAPAMSGTGDLPGAPEPPLERAVGQILLMSFDGTAAPDYILRRLRRGEGAGVILFGKNAPDPATLVALTRRLQRAAGGAALVATDQEGGDIRSVPFAPPESSQGVLSTPEAAAGAATEAASALRAAGIFVNLAPVADVAQGSASVVAGRAFGAEPGVVGDLVAASVRAHEEERVAATVKHFPGLGAAGANTDDESVTVSSTREQLEAADLPAFRAAIEAGVPLVMSSHALYPALDEEAIASQSRPVLVDLLRERLGFEGVVVTDSLEAQAVLDRSGIAEAAVRSVEAGNDLVLMTGSGSWNLVYPALLRRARTDPGFEDRVREAAARVHALRERLGLKAPG